jgi:hypothetical protein
MPDLDSALDDDIGDEMLRLIFTACHPRLSRDARTALALRMICGLTTEEIARAFLLPDATIAQRIVRAKRTLSESGLAYETPTGEELSERLSSVLEVVYLIFNEGYTAARGQDWLRPELCNEALRMARVLTAIAPHEPEAHGLLALMELNATRTAARTDPAGEPILMLDQDRALWDQLQIRRGVRALGRACELAGAGGFYALQAAIIACHAQARTAGDTDWPRIAELYAELATVVRSPIIELRHWRCAASRWRSSATSTARMLLRRAARTFGSREAVARARCIVAEAEIALVSRDLNWPTKSLEAAQTALEKYGDLTNAAHGGYLAIRRLLLIGRLDAAERLLTGFDPTLLLPASRAGHELVIAGIAMRRLQIKAARAALALAGHAARQARIPSLAAEVRRRGACPRHAGGAAYCARRGACSSARRNRIPAAVDACRLAVCHAGRVISLEMRPVLFALARGLAEAWPGDVPRAALLARAFRAKHADDSHRARLRVEIGRLRKALGMGRRY